MFYNVLVTPSNFTKFRDLSLNLFGIIILDFYEIRTGYCNVSTYSSPDLIFLCMSSNEYILGNISCI